MEDLDEARQLVRGGHYTALKALYDGVSQPLSELIRTALIPEPGHQFLVADFSAIEARVIAWLAGERWRLDAFREGADIYCASASQAFHVPVVKHGINGHLRQKGKIMELACGYGGGIGAMKAFGADKLGMTEAEMQETVDLWRESSPRICEFWRSLEKAAIRSVARHAHTVSEIGGIAFDLEQGVLWMTLPSGRRIAYWGAKYEESPPERWPKGPQLHGSEPADQEVGTDRDLGGKIGGKLCPEHRQRLASGKPCSPWTPLALTSGRMYTMRSSSRSPLGPKGGGNGPP